MGRELFELQALGFFQSEWSAILAILGMGTLYLLAPVMGYDPTRRGPVLAAMWGMVLKIAIGLFRTSLLVLNVMSAGTLVSKGNGLFADFEQTLHILLPLGETVVFLGSMVLFVYGLQRLRRREMVFRPPGRQE